MKSLLIVGLLLFGFFAQAQDDVCVAQFNAYVQSKKDLGVPEKHLPQLNLGDPQRSHPTILFIHGLFESPHFFQSINQNMSNHSYNTLSILLPGHWEGDLNAMDKITYVDWMNEVEKTIQIAQCFNPKIIFAGHSLGGLLSMKAVLDHPQIAVGLLMWVPAVQMTAVASIGSSIGSLLHVDGNIFVGRPADHDESAALSPNGGMQIYRLIQYIGRKYGDPIPTYGNEPRRDYPLSYLHIYQQISVPVFLGIAEKDPAVSTGELKALYGQIKTDKEAVVYDKKSGVWHANILKTDQDAYLRKPEDINPRFDDLSDHVLLFLDSLITVQ